MNEPAGWGKHPEHRAVRLGAGHKPQGGRNVWHANEPTTYEGARQASNGERPFI